MPHYDFICAACQQPSRLFFTYQEYDTARPTCPHCHGDNMQRHIGRIALAKSEDSRMDTLLGDQSLANLDEDDPKAMGQFMRKMGREMGEDLGTEFDEVVDRLEHGQAPDAIEQAMPDLGAGAGGDS